MKSSAAKYDFDAIVDVRNTASIKWDRLEAEFGSRVIPMWVADMDFAAPPELLQALKARIEKGILGYTYPSEAYYEAVVNWLRDRHAWEVPPEWLVPSPGVVFSIGLLIQAFTLPGDNVVVQPPVYPWFYSAVRNNQREVVYNSLEVDSSYVMNLEDLRHKIDARTKMLILCSPHNPVGRVWSAQELSRLGEICLEHELLLVSDEIHADLVFQPHRHRPLASIAPELAASTVTLIAPTKTFNVAGVHSSTAVISDPKLRAVVLSRMRRLGVHFPSLLGMVATQAAYTQCSEWLDQLLSYLNSNTELAVDFLTTHVPRIGAYKPEGTYLMWLDFRELGLNEADLKRLLVEQAKVGFTPGTFFGPGGEGFQRMNVACPQGVLRQALRQLADACAHAD